MFSCKSYLKKKITEDKIYKYKAELVIGLNWKQRKIVCFVSIGLLRNCYQTYVYSLMFVAQTVIMAALTALLKYNLGQWHQQKYFFVNISHDTQCIEVLQVSCPRRIPQG